MSSALASTSGIATRGRSLVGLGVGVGALLLALALPAFAIRAWSSVYADALGNAVAARLIAVVPALPPALEEGSSDARAEQCEEPGMEPRDHAASNVGGAALGAKPARGLLRARAVPRAGIRVSSAQVLALAARRAMPNAVFVKATAQRPAGLQLSGVSALGIGIEDGDVLTEAAGQKASSVAVVVGVVLAARARQATEISGRFYRAGLPFSLTVEQPYPKGAVPG